MKLDKTNKQNLHIKFLTKWSGSMKRVNVALLGIGNVGTGVYKIFNE